MRSLFFGLGVNYQNATDPAVALSKSGVIYEVHADGDDLSYRLGHPREMTVDWDAPVPYDTGETPSIAVSANAVVEIHKSQNNDDLWFNVGIPGTKIAWKAKGKHDTGRRPRISVNDAGVVVEVHQHPDKDKLYYNIGSTNGLSLDWKTDGEYISDGARPSVAINAKGQVVLVFDRGPSIYMRVGTIDGDRIRFGDEIGRDNGTSPSIALTDDGATLLTYGQSNAEGWSGAVLLQVPGNLEGANVTMDGAASVFDYGVGATCAMQGNLAVQVHSSATFSQCYFSTSLVMDRGRWMSNRLDELGELPLRKLTLPASHDASMYQNTGTAALGQTQDLRIYDQLSMGVRWFDLRPTWNGTSIDLYHGWVSGPSLTSVLQEIQYWLLKPCQELIVLKFSHFDNWNSTANDQLMAQVTAFLGSYLYKKPLPDGQTLGEVPLAQYVSAGACVLVVMDKDWGKGHSDAGFWIYRDSTSSSAKDGHLRVYDVYYGYPDYAGMKADQFDKFQKYTGLCADGKTPCDLFLLSWTCTLITYVWSVAQDPDRFLGSDMTELAIPNGYGQIVNLVYLDFVEYARPTDVAIMMAGLSLD
ncbi:MAG TPA: phosphatidylinositol-specific phospholipase C domain-containing protein [Thermoanaerobaculia bacterium]